MDSTTAEQHQPWYWKVFSGLIIATTTVLLGTVFNTLYGNMQQYRNEVQETQRKLWGEVKEVKAELSTLKSDSATIREKLMQSEKTITAALSQSKDQDKTILEMRERIIRLEAIKSVESKK
jgi:septal ring factor EnvC (AmiA/AmiB activator)